MHKRASSSRPVTPDAARGFKQWRYEQQRLAVQRSLANIHFRIWEQEQWLQGIDRELDDIERRIDDLYGVPF